MMALHERSETAQQQSILPWQMMMETREVNINHLGVLHILCEESSFAGTITVVNNHVYVTGTIGDKAALCIDGALFYTLKHTSNFADVKVVPK